MNVNDPVARAKQNQYSNTVTEYITKHNGHIIALSDDQSFLTLLRMTIIKELGLMQSDVLTIVNDPPQLLRIIKNVQAKHPSAVVFLERTMGGRDLSFLVQQFKDAFPDLRVIVLTITAEKARLMLLHEVGADNFIAKPVSTNTIIEKLAFTLRPQNKLGQIIDAAKLLVAQDRPSDALKLCEQIMQLKPNSAAGYLVMGDAYRALGDRDKARESYENASKNADLFLEPLRRLADLYGENGDNETRLRYLQRLDALSPLNVDRKVDMGEIHLTLGNAEEAERLFDTAVTQVTKDAMTHISSIAGRIASLYAESNPQQAERYLRKSLETKANFLSIEDINIFNQLGISLRQQGRWKDAILEYTKALKIAPNDENLYYNMGMACAEGKDFPTARNHMIKALELNPELPYTAPNIAYNIGVVFLQADSRERAQHCLKIALELSPSFTAAQKALARITGAA